MPVIGEPGIVTVQRPDVWEIDGFSFHNQINPISIQVADEGPITQIHAYAAVEVVAGVLKEEGGMKELGRGMVRIENGDFVSAIARHPGLYALMAQTLYEELQLLGHIPLGIVVLPDGEREAILAYAHEVINKYESLPATIGERTILEQMEESGEKGHCCGDRGCVGDMCCQAN